MEFKEDQIVMITEYYPNGKKYRTVGVITQIEEPNVFGKHRVHLHPLPEKLAKPIRDKYCDPEGFNHQGIENNYNDRYGFACWYVSKETTVILGEHKIRRAHSWYPQPGNIHYDLTC